MPCGEEHPHTHKDPVCGMDVEHSEDAISSMFEGETYYFCCEGCKDEFHSNPTKYIS